LKLGEPINIGVSFYRIHHPYFP